MNDSSTRIPVFVLPEHVSNVYGYVAALEEGRATTTEDVVEDGVPLIDTWTREEIARAYQESPRGMKYIFDGMIDRAGDVLDANDLAGAFVTFNP